LKRIGRFIFVNDAAFCEVPDPKFSTLHHMSDRPTVILYGRTDVGKTGLFLRMTDNRFDPVSRATLGQVDKMVTVERNGERHTFLLRDTAGQEKFLSMTKEYFRSASVVLFVFSITDQMSLDEKILEIVAGLQKEWPQSQWIFVGNKTDLEDERVVESAKGREFADKYNSGYCETSALTGEGIPELTGEIVDRLSRPNRADIQPGKAGLNLERGSRKKSGAGEKGECC
jgi:small GTP-binding protein